MYAYPQVYGSGSGLGFSLTIPSFIPIVGGTSVDTGSGGGYNVSDVAKYACSAPESGTGPITSGQFLQLFKTYAGLQAKVAGVWSGVNFGSAGAPKGTDQVACFADWIMATSWADLDQKIQAIVAPYMGGGNIPAPPPNPHRLPGLTASVGKTSWLLAGVAGVVALAYANRR